MKNIIFFVVSLVLIAGTALQAQPTSTLTYQGYVENNGVAVDGSVAITVRLFSQSSGGVAAWSQDFPSVTVTKGVYSLLLDVATLAFDSQYWLETEINGLVSASRTQLTGAPYAFGPWRYSAGGLASPSANEAAAHAAPPGTIYYMNGPVGIGTANPSQLLTVAGGPTAEAKVAIDAQGDNYAGLQIRNNQRVWNLQTVPSADVPGGRLRLTEENSGLEFLSVTTVGLGIGAKNPVSKLTVGGDVNADTKITVDAGGDNYAGIQIRNNQRIWNWQAVPSADVPAGRLRLTEEFSGQEFMSVTTTGIGIGTKDPTAKLEVVGHTKTQVLEITGGGDFSENFDVSNGVSGAPEVQPGMVVSIDPAEPGKLVLSSSAYDRRIAGIISGAGGISPGMVMGQKNSIVNGKYPVALSGRVYCWADASKQPIDPGDMLTSSSVPGHAMKAARGARSIGAILGKAMTGLKHGRGLVLVLVNLQ